MSDNRVIDEVPAAPQAETTEITDADLEDVAGGSSDPYMRINNDGKFHNQADPSKI